LGLERWNHADLEARLCRALDVALQTVETFAVGGYANEASPSLGFGPEKPAAETAMLIYAASHCGRPTIASRIDQLANALSPCVRSERVCIDIALHPALALKFAVPHVLLTRLGFADDVFDVFLKTCLTSEVRNGQDRPPSAVAEKNWILSLWNGASANGTSRPSVAESVLRWPLDILGGMREDAYAFTHLLMYCTDFGFRIRGLRGRRSGLVDQAASLLVRYLDVEDYDLAGEILLTWPLTGAAWSSSAAFAFRVLASVEDQAGILPCGNMNLKRLDQLQGDERTRYALATAYHTAYVMGFLCAASLRPGRMPPTRMGGTQHDRACLKRLLDHVRDDQGHWQPVFWSLTETEQEMLVPFILDMGIMQNCRRREYNAVSEILDIAARNHLEETALSRQAAGLLGRIGACSTAFSLR
jgi:hypothetical protein